MMLALQGLDTIKSSMKFFTSSATDSVIIRESPEVELVPRSVPSRFMELALRYAEKKVLAYKANPSDDDFLYITMKEYLDTTKAVARAFISLGLERHRAISIIGRNCPQWVIAFHAAIFAGGFGSGMYPTTSSTSCYNILDNAAVQIVLVEDDHQLAKVLAFKDKLPELKAIIQYDGTPLQAGILKWDELVKMGKALEDAELKQRLSTIAVNECCALIYTSGTTGLSKAVMLSHDNIYFSSVATVKAYELTAQDICVSHLPLSHIASQIIDLFSNVLGAPFLVYFANKDALKGTIFKTIKEVRPTFVITVPRVLEKVADMIKQYYQDGTFLQQWALVVADKRLNHLLDGAKTSALERIVAKQLVHSKIKAKLGFGRLKTLVAGGAQCPFDVKKWLLAADILCYEGYGMSETTGAILTNRKDCFKLSTMGKQLPGYSVMLTNPILDAGELCLKGRNIFMGYLNNEDETNKSTNSEGWLLSGDLASMDEEGFLTFVGRVKEILVTSGGENIAPLYIENNIKEALPFVSQAMVVANGRKYPSVLLTLGCQLDPKSGIPTDELNALSIKWLTDLGLNYKTISSICDSGPNEKIMESIQQGINIANEKALSRAQRVQKFYILPTDFSIATEELGPTMKLKRQFIAEKYKSLIDKMYEV